MTPAAPDGGSLRDALRGAVGFLTRLPVAGDGAAWTAFAETPPAFPLVGYAVGLLAAAPAGVLLLAGTPPATAALAYLLAVYLVTGAHHADGVADLGDAAAVHGDPDQRLAALTDPTVGAGGVLALTTVVAGLALAGLALAGLPPLVAAGLVVAAEVSAKLGMAAVSCLGRAAHEGLGAALVTRADPAQLAGPLAAALPAAALTWPSPAGAGALVAGLAVAVGLLQWAAARLGGTNGDVFGAANEFGRVAALHLGVVTWTLT